MERLIESKFVLKVAYYTRESYDDTKEYMDNAIQKIKEEFANLTTDEICERIKLTLHPWEED